MDSNGRTIRSPEARFRPLNGKSRETRLRDAGLGETDIAVSRPHAVKRRPSEEPFDKQTPLSWLLSVVSGLDLGLKVSSIDNPVPHPIHLNHNDDIKSHFRRLEWGGSSWLKHRWTKSVLASHCSGKQTYYFAGASERYKPYSLVMIDVDCHKSGSLEGAMAFLKHLRELRFPNLYFEPSTNGNGGHGYFLLNKEDLGTQALKPLLTQKLQPWLNEVAEDFDVEFVEVKGLPPELSWGADRFELKSYKAGVLAKLPRGLVNRFEELRETTVVKAHELRRLPVVERKTKKREAVVLGLSQVAGSIAGRHFREEHLSGLKEGGRYHSLASALLSDRKMITCSGAQVVVEDVAIFLMIGEFFSNHMNADGSLPTARWASMWAELFGAGDVDRAWDHKRFKLVRDLVSSLGLIEWNDASYCWGKRKLNGDYVPGKAAKWKFSEELMQKLSDLAECERTSDLEKKEKHPLWEEDLIKWSSNLQRTPDNETIRPFWVEPLPTYLHSPDELTHFVSPITSVAA